MLGIQIYPGDNKPYFITKEGHQKGVYVRIGSHTMRANEQFLEELKLQRENRAYDELLALRSQISSLDKGLIEECFKQKISNHLLESNRIVGRDHISQQLFPTIGGVVMFHDNPTEVMTEAYISCALMRGTSGRHIIEFKDFHGPLVRISHSALELAANWLERDFSLKGGKLEGELLVPFEALRESIYNAVLHRKYNIPGPVKLTLWRDRLEIFSPGSFPGLMDKQNLGDGTTYIRNRALSLIARKIGLMEKRGTGIRLIIDSCKAKGDVEPVFEEGADWVKVTFKFLTEGQRKNVGIDGRFMALLRERDVISNRDVVEACMVSRETANKLIKKGIKKGLLQKEGEGRSTRYWIVDSNRKD
ncbi:MAG: ATP-binding protein [Pseudomonadota bacterium]